MEPKKCKYPGCDKIISDGLYCESCSENRLGNVVMFKGVNVKEVRNILQDDVGTIKVYFAAKKENKNKKQNTRIITEKIKFNPSPYLKHASLMRQFYENGLIVNVNKGRIIVEKNKNNDLSF